MFDAPAAYLREARHRAKLHEYLSDLVQPHGIALREGARDAREGQSYGEMAEALIRESVPEHEPIDLLVLAFAVPDVRPGRATAAYLSEVCPGNPMAFAVCDQGSAAAFTGLRLALGPARDGDRRRSAVLVLEQAALGYEPPVPVALPARHAAVALVLGPAGDRRLDTVRQHAGVDPQRAGDLLAAQLAELSAGQPDTIVVLGGDLPDPPGYHVCRARGDQPDTGVWSALAGVLAGEDGSAPPDARVVVASYDRALRYLCLAVVERRTEPTDLE